jgi:hypothetical protein
MTEVRRRISIVDLATTNNFPIQPPFVREVCYLQFRMMCELFALGCLVAHGDIVRTTELKKAWEADKIMKSLEGLHPEFYPYAAKANIKDAGVFNFEACKDQPLPKGDLIKLYHGCGQFLHKGSLKKILSKQIPAEVKYPDLTAIAQRFRDLISCHFTVMHDGDQVFVCQSNTVGIEATVAVAIAESYSMSTMTSARRGG